MSTTEELDVGPVPAARRLAELTARFAAMAVGDTLTVTGTRDDLDALRTAFARDWPGAYRWEDGRLTKLASTRLPRVLANTADLAGGDTDETGGARWRLETSPRDLDANLIHLPPRDGIATHTGPDLDVMMIVVDGAGRVETEIGEVTVRIGDVVWLPGGSRRAVVAGDAGLSYLTVHPRRAPMTIGRAGSAGVFAE